MKAPLKDTNSDDLNDSKTSPDSGASKKPKDRANNAKTKEKVPI